MISTDFSGFLHAVITIKVDGGGESIVQLSSEGKDKWDAGWRGRSSLDSFRRSLETWESSAAAVS